MNASSTHAAPPARRRWAWLCRLGLALAMVVGMLGSTSSLRAFDERDGESKTELEQGLELEGGELLASARTRVRQARQARASGISRTPTKVRARPPLRTRPPVPRRSAWGPPPIRRQLPDEDDEDDEAIG